MKKLNILLLVIVTTILNYQALGQTKNIDANGLSNNLIGYFSFDDAGNGVQCDWGTGKDKVGTLNGGAAFTTTDFKYSTTALHIDGSAGDAYVGFDSDNSLPFIMGGASEITISCWIKPAQDGEQYLVTTMDQNGGDTHRLEITADNRFRANIATVTQDEEGKNIFDSGTAQSLDVKLVDDLPLDTWIHVAYVYSGVNNRTTIYVDGVDVGFYEKTSYDLVTFNRLLNLGAYVALNKADEADRIQKQYNGLMDELYFFDRALSIEEINTVKDLQNPLDEAPFFTGTFDYDYDNLSDQLDATIATNYMISVPTPVRNGYIFGGWYTDKNGAGDKLIGEEVEVVSDMTYYANWELQTYTITFNKAEGIETLEFDLNDLPLTLTEDVKADEHFLGWFKNAEKIDLVIGAQLTEVGDIELWSGFSTSAVFYEVILIDREQTLCGLVATEETSYMLQLPQLTRNDNYRFAGWFTEENGLGTHITTYSSISENKTLYTKWSSMTSDENSTIDIDGLSQNLVGYFSFDESVEGDVVSNQGISKGTKGSLVGTGAKIISSDTQYSSGALEIDPSVGDAYVSFDIDNSNDFRMRGATALSIALWIQPHQLGEQYILATQNDNRSESYRLIVNGGNQINAYLNTYSADLGKYDNAFATGNSHTIGNQVSLNDWIHVAVVYDSEIGKTVIYINGEFSGEFAKDSYNLKLDTDFKLNLGASVAINQASSVEKQFDGLMDELYIFDRALTAAEITAIKGLHNPIDPITEYIAVFDVADGVTYDTLKTTAIQNFEVDVTSIETPVKNGYTFNGWFTERNGSGIQLSESTLALTEDVTYYAHWVLDTYTLTLNKESGVVTQNFTVTDLPLTFTDDTKDDAFFIGWFTDNQFDQKFIGNSINKPGDFELWSAFTANELTYSITLTDRGSHYNEKVATQENAYKVSLPKLMNREDNYRFAGWYTSENGNGQLFKDETTVSANVVLYAHWTPMYSSTVNYLDKTGLSTNLIGYFSFDENETADVVTDYGSAKGNIGNFVGAGTVLEGDARYSNGALKIDPSTESSYLSFDLDNSNPFIMKGAEEVTVSMWIKPNDLVSTDQYLVSTNDDNGGASYHIKLRNDNRINAFIPLDGGSSFATSDNHKIGGELEANSWIHVAMVYSKSESYTKIYINGVESSNPENRGGFFLQSNENRKINIGANVAINRGEAIKDQYEGLIDELYFHDKALSAAEIITLRDLHNPTEGLKELIAVFDLNYDSKVDTIKVTELDNFTVDGSTITAPVREGYTFLGWFDNKKGEGDAYTPGIMVLTNDVTYYAKWEITEYTITYQLDNGVENVANPTTFTINDLPLKLQNPTKTDEFFRGWYKDAAFENQLELNSITDLADIDVWAKFSTIQIFSINFYNQGELFAIELTDDNGDFNIPEVEREGYTFEGWYLEENFETRLSSDTEIIEDLSVYAKWEVIKYTISFNENGGSEVLDITLAEGEALEVPADPTKEGVIFDGWYLDIELTNMYTFPSTMTAENFTLYAKWRDKVAYTITFNENGGSEIADITALEGAAISTPENPTKEGYTFAGWFTDAEYENLYELPAVMPSNNVDLSAKWNVIEYSITYNLNGGVQNDLNTSTFTIEDLPLTLSNPSKEEEYFRGWFTDASLENKLASNQILAIGDIEIWANYSDKATYSISFYSENEVIAVEITDEELNFSIPTIERTGYTFNGWYLENAFENEFSENSIISSDISVYAKWSVNEYTISFNENGGSTIEDIVLLFGESVIVPSAPILEGYTFDGWYTDTEFTTEFTFPETMLAENRTIYAKWSINQYTITFIENGGNEIEDITLDYNAKLTLPEDPIYNPFIFEGWFTDEILTTEYTFTETMPAYNVTLYAKWTVDQNWVGGIDIRAFSPTCKGLNDGEISITAGNSPIKVTLSNWEVTIQPGETQSMQGLASSVYEIIISLTDGTASINYEIEVPVVESIESTAEVSGNRVMLQITGGVAPYTVHIGNEIYTDVEDGELEISNLREGLYNAVIMDNSSCATSNINFTVGSMLIYPNPAVDKTLKAVLPFDIYSENVRVVITGVNGIVHLDKVVNTISGRKVTLNVEGLPSGQYLLNIICSEEGYNDTKSFIVK
ncbi:InlB B-repeat-containing protein [Flammeovirga kamogawensis]|uniref:InlB B-repeat-containing protein n=1 Tax=Flammeovirga kamogawensis TaxID=373891 RepID=A0ABX8H1E3_9BACT|nr:InlB B-repeat-containing protein [Flammeovirga kamogawensis]MBB6463647.1 putative repeat protein (TIGR02543 family) [Flammeovirga kamogawensis]QWG09261.1 InlB B-repeat-containing protein [Flammeovirga kamogawensis]TRX64785.1 hypothetical protein EO216_19805 [Flammeovirga kamogawensis]